MIYTNLTKKAMQIAFEAHKEQVDKSGLPYIFHPFYLAMQMKSEDEVIVALLHDALEDSELTLYDLRAQGFSYRVTDALSLLTRKDGADYMDYIQNIKFSPLATKVKLADLRHNSDITRLEAVDNNSKKRLEKYKKAIGILTSGKCLMPYSPGKDGETKYFKTEHSVIIKVENGLNVYRLADNGNFEPWQDLFKLFIDDMRDYKPILETEANDEIQIRKQLSRK
jgi:hypothetical protein